MASAIFSSAIILLFWDGSLELVLNTGLWGLLINVAILMIVLRLKWSALAF
jgi:hypothetical protein